MRSSREKRRNRLKDVDFDDKDDLDEGMSLLGRRDGFARRRMEEEEYGNDYEGKCFDRKKGTRHHLICYIALFQRFIIPFLYHQLLNYEG